MIHASLHMLAGLFPFTACISPHGYWHVASARACCQGLPLLAVAGVVGKEIHQTPHAFRASLCNRAMGLLLQLLRLLAQTQPKIRALVRGT